MAEAVKIGIFTSGGDSPGMNAAVRAATRRALSLGCQVCAIHDGFAGMYNNDIRALTWKTVAGVLPKGGTIIGTARCAEFREKAGRRIAAKNLVTNGINSLLCIGGDGSLTGANILLQEWTEHLTALRAENAISQQQHEHCKELKLVGFTGTIDNDMYGTDQTIGVWTALTRIVDAIDCLMSTAESHRRAFVVECMGRHAGYLSLMAALVTGAEYVFVPEAPPCCNEPADSPLTWQRDLCNVLTTCRAKSRASVVVVCEGATDRHGAPISAAQVRDVLQSELGVDSRLTVLGHVQRGGVPVPADRFIAIQMAHRAVDTLLTRPATPLCVGMRGMRCVLEPLEFCVAQCRAVGDALAAGDFERAQQLRDAPFREALTVMRAEHSFLTAGAPPRTKPRRIGILTCGAPAPGMSPCVAMLARLFLARGDVPLGVRNGFVGLVAAADAVDEAHGLVPLDWFRVRDFLSMGGSTLSCTRQVAGRDVLLTDLARALVALRLDALVVIGGFEAYASVDTLRAARASHAAFNLPLMCVPATISSNLPASDCSLGCDRGLTNLVEAVDKVKQSAVGMRRLFVIEVMGRRCGYLTLMGALCSGADSVLLPERTLALCDLEQHVSNLQQRFGDARDHHYHRCGVLIKNESAGEDVFTVDFLCNLFAASANGAFDVRKSVLGHLQQGGLPTVVDRVNALRMSLAVADRIDAALSAGDATCECVGIVDGAPKFTDMKLFQSLVDPDARRPLDQWWLELLQPFNDTAHPPRRRP